ncbi:hypothetical protein [Rhodocista pekingensis]|uniref:DUF4233 domain-containing protein n=1 Tax=Rhodocista pekingensis TaxID=201185 RepID=A0ABW2KU58_9PROT
MSVLDDQPPAGFPIQPVALKILGDGVLAATIVRASDLPPDQGLWAMLLAFIIAVLASMAAGTMLVRRGQRELWDVTSVACLGAMAVLLFLNGALLVGLLMLWLAWYRWQRIEAGGGGDGA